jgi:hypothetical protein
MCLLGIGREGCQSRVMSRARGVTIRSGGRRRAATGGVAALLVLGAAACGADVEDSVAAPQEETSSGATAWPAVGSESPGGNDLEAPDADAEAGAETGAPAGADSGAGSSNGAGSATGSGSSGSPGTSGGSAPAPFSGTTGASRGESGGAVSLSLTGIRLGGHEGFDRVVFELGGEGVPGWQIEYVDVPTQDGSGNRIDVPGSAFLQVYLTGVGYPFDTGVPEYDGPRTVTAPDVQVIRGVTTAGVYEGRAMLAIGLSEVKPYRVQRLEGPPRVVVDVAR